MEKAVTSGRVFVTAGVICRALASVTLVAACTDGQIDNPRTSSTEDAITGVTHPLDPLTPDEINAAIAAVQAKGYAVEHLLPGDPAERAVEVVRAVMDAPGSPIPRKAFVVVFIDTPPSGVTRELVVSLDRLRPSSAITSDPASNRRC
jgi:Cu2+-containing amine oxidase